LVQTTKRRRDGNGRSTSQDEPGPLRDPSEPSEPSSGTRVAAVDAHHHLWDLSVSHYSWLHPNPAGDPFPDFVELCRDYTIEDYRVDCAKDDIVKSVHLQAEHDADDPIRETAWLQAIADDSRSAGFPHAIVGGADLARGDVEQVLEAQASFANVRGIRQILNRDSTAASGESAEKALASRANQLEDEGWLRNFALLRRFDLSFDLQLFPWQTHEARELLRRHPDTQIILNHALMPFDRSADGLALWRRGLAIFAAYPNVALKISGLGMAPGGWDETLNRELVTQALEAFGTQRCLFASNYPIDRLTADYDTIWALFRDAVSPLSADEQRAVLRGNAERVYRI
jgi:predicted TIM-barrel fold metal-dependent hydrolase